MAATSLVVLIIAHTTSEPLSVAFAQAARGVLGADATIAMLEVPSDPEDEQSVARAGAADGVIELSWESDGNSARVHCYIAAERRWVDREVRFGSSRANPAVEGAERGRLLGFAAATMFASGPAPEPERAAAPAVLPNVVAERRPAAPKPPSVTADPTRDLEFAGIASTGIDGTAGGLGAAAALRVAWTGPLWARAMVGGRAGNIPLAQATTRTVLLGAGVALRAQPWRSVELGARLDAFATYFEATHLSEDDVVPATRRRWLPAADLVVEAGMRFAGSAGLFAGGGCEVGLGRTDVYTHGIRVATVPPLRAVGEIGIRVGF